MRVIGRTEKKKPPVASVPSKPTKGKTEQEQEEKKP